MPSAPSREFQGGIGGRLRKHVAAELIVGRLFGLRIAMQERTDVLDRDRLLLNRLRDEDVDDDAVRRPQKAYFTDTADDKSREHAAQHPARDGESAVTEVKKGLNPADSYGIMNNRDILPERFRRSIKIPCSR